VYELARGRRPGGDGWRRYIGRVTPREKLHRLVDEVSETEVEAALTRSIRRGWDLSAGRWLTRQDADYDGPRGIRAMSVTIAGITTTCTK
jgi:hypothetical protein